VYHQQVGKTQLEIVKKLATFRDGADDGTEVVVKQDAAPRGRSTASSVPPLGYSSGRGSGGRPASNSAECVDLPLLTVPVMRSRCWRRGTIKRGEGAWLGNTASVLHNRWIVDACDS
jgi:hypothetical protein